MTEMRKVYSRTNTFRKDMVAGFCPVCMHGTIFKLIGEPAVDADTGVGAVRIQELAHFLNSSL